LTAKDVPKNESVTRFGQTHTVGGGFEGLYRVLADKKVQYVGEAVALVAAETEEIAEQALELIKLEYEPLPGVFDPLEAMKPGAPQVEEGKDNIITHAIANALYDAVGVRIRDLPLTPEKVLKAIRERKKTSNLAAWAPRCLSGEQQG
jgi:CO/xanthine dehydrogenase Mo-binding subunit